MLPEAPDSSVEQPDSHSHFDSDGNGLLFDLDGVGSREPVFFVIEGTGDGSGGVVDLAEYNPTPDDLLVLLKELRGLAEEEFEEYRRQIQRKDSQAQVKWSTFFASLEKSDGDLSLLLGKIRRAEELLGYDLRLLESRRRFDTVISTLQEGGYESLRRKPELELLIEELEALGHRYQVYYERAEDSIDAVGHVVQRTVDWNEVSEDAWGKALRNVDADVLDGRIHDFIMTHVGDGSLSAINIKNVICGLRQKLEAAQQKASAED